MKKITIDTEFLKLGQLLKLADCIDSGGQAKAFLSEATIHVNGELENRRGRKLFRGDKIMIKGHGEFEIS